MVTAFELSQRKIPCLIIDQEGEQNLGGQAFWSLGGIFMVDSASQRRVGIRDTRELAMQDWMDSAGFDREEEDRWPRQWAKAFVDFAADKMEDYVKARGLKFVSVGWAERGSGRAEGHGNSVPRFHLSWGTGPEVVRVFADPVKKAVQKGTVGFKFRHMVTELVVDEKGAAIGVKGQILRDDGVERGAKSSREVVDTFELRGSAVVVCSGGIGGNLELVKKAWPTDRLGPTVPTAFVVGVPDHVDGRMIGVAQAQGAHVINMDRMWHYTEGLRNWNSIWPKHGIRVLPAPSSLWLDANGHRLPPYLYPGSDTLATLKHICSTGYPYSWFILNKTIISREFALSGSEQNPDITNKSIFQFIRSRLFSSGGPPPVQRFLEHGEDFVVQDNLRDLITDMNRLARDAQGPELKYEEIETILKMRDSQVDHAYSKDAQIMLIRNARTYWPEKYTRVAPVHRILDPKHGPLIAVQMNLLTRKSLGGLETDLQARVMNTKGQLFPGLYAAGEAAGFGGGGVHGYNSLEGTFLGGCIFSGYTAGYAVADEILGRPLKSKV